MSYEFRVVDGDIVRNHTNTGYLTVSDGEKLRQNCRMIVTTAIRADGIGMGLDRMLGNRSDDEPENAFKAPAMFQFQNMVYSGISRFRYVQRNYLFNRRTPKELLEEIDPVQIFPLDTDPRSFNWKIAFYSFAYKTSFSLSGVLRGA